MGRKSTTPDEHCPSNPPLILYNTAGTYNRPLAKPLLERPSGYFCYDTARLNYLNLRQRLFAQDAQDLSVLLRLVQHEYESPWDEPRNTDEDDVQIFSYVMGRNLLATHFIRLGAPVPYLGECVTIGSSVVTIMEHAAVVCVDFVDPSSPKDQIKAICTALSFDQTIPEPLRELVACCSEADLITTISPLKTRRAYNLAKQKTLLLAEHIWKGFWQDAWLDLKKEKFENRGVRYPETEQLKGPLAAR